jgi:hypothetical protein
MEILYRKKGRRFRIADHVLAKSLLKVMWEDGKAKMCREPGDDEAPDVDTRRRPRRQCYPSMQRVKRFPIGVSVARRGPGLSITLFV